jgi:hypothetical protein
MGSLVRSSSEDFDQWAFAIGRLRRAPHGKTDMLISSFRRECVDHVVVFGGRHLRHVLLSDVKYDNEARTHLSLNRNAPAPLAVERAGHILCGPLLGGLHHQYVRI